MNPFRVGVLGATGLVGQRLVRQLDGHPWFALTAVAASDRSVGKPYAEATRWRLPEGLPESIGGLVVRACDAETLDDCDVVFSALDTGVARELEPRFRAAGFAVISNSSAFRMDPDVPLLIPEVNPSHVALIDRQMKADGDGFIVTNPNCSTTGLALVAAPLHQRFGIRRLVVTTLQAISGAGAEGPRALDLVDNVLPYIPGEEEKLEQELARMLGAIGADGVTPADMPVSAHCHRVGTLDGHLEAVSVELDAPAAPAEVSRVLAEFRAPETERPLPSAPDRPLVVRAEPDRPQPRLDRDVGGGMTVVVGRVRDCPVFGVKLELLSHNTLRGAAGGTLLNAELLAAAGRLPRRNAR